MLRMPEGCTICASLTQKEQVTERRTKETKDQDIGYIIRCKYVANHQNEIVIDNISIEHKGL